MYRRLLTLSVVILTGLASVSAVHAAKIGESIPHNLSLKDQTGANVSFETLKGEKGLVVFFVRSADWCPFCQQQLKDFITRYQGFKDRGYEVASVSYDSVEKLNRFSTQYAVPYTMLSDPASESIKAFDILNTKYTQASRFYGIPYPTIYVINAQGVITHMFSESGYKARPPVDGILRSLD
jgi:peroxiredoxin